MNTFAENKKWEEKHFAEAKLILESQLSKIVKISLATPEEDMTMATDAKIVLTGSSIALRVRRDTGFRDFTIRAYNRGNKTEIEKLREGYCDWYLYMWTVDDTVKDWILVDMNKMRQSGLLEEQRNVKMNRDNSTGFIAYSIQELEAYGLIVAKHINGDSSTNEVWTINSNCFDD